MDAGKNSGTKKQDGFRKILVLVAAINAVTMMACSRPATQGSINSGLDGDLSSQAGIIGGTDADGTEEFAPTVALLYDRAGRFLCTTSILSESLLVTAAHCLKNPAENLVLVFGTHINAPNRELRDVAAYAVSPLWAFRQDEMRNAGDIAMVKFSGGLPSGYKPAELLTDVAALQDGGTVLLAGYGQSNAVAKSGSGQLRYVEVNILDRQFSETEVTLDQTQGRGACHGDSGGPAYVRVNGRLMLWGVTNRGIEVRPGPHCDETAVYASIPAYSQWLNQTAQQLALVQ